MRQCSAHSVRFPQTHNLQNSPSQPPYTQIFWHFRLSRTVLSLGRDFTVGLHHFINQPLEPCQACYGNDNAIPFELVLLLYP